MTHLPAESEIKATWKYTEPPLVSVTIITYNHERHIAPAIEGTLIQKTSFPFEIIIHDDASTDATQKIIREYAEKYPSLIYPILQIENYWLGKGINATTNIVWPNAKGKYIAWCEGDDYWTDPLKLQKQVDFLEAHPDFVGAFHDCIILNENDGTQRLRIGDTPIDESPDLISIIKQKNAPTASLIFRNCFDDNFWPQETSTIRNADYLLVVLLARYGRFKYFPKPMSVYRVHGGGVWSSQKRLYTAEQDIKFYTYLHHLFDTPELRQAIETKLKASYHKYAIELVKAGSIIKSLAVLKKALSNNLHGQITQKRILSTYSIVLASKVKQVLFPFLPPFSNLKNAIKK